MSTNFMSGASWVVIIWRYGNNTETPLDVNFLT